MKKTYLVLFLAFICSSSIFGQAHFQLGYGVGYTNPRDINRVIYLYNRLHYNLSKEMPKVHFTHGYTIGVSFGKEFKVEIHRTSRRALVTAEFEETDGSTTVRQFRMVTNTLNFGLAFGLSKRWDFGASLDIGNFKGHGRVGPEDDRPKFSKLFNLDKGLLPNIQFGFTAFAQRNFGFFAVRLYYQLQPFTQTLNSFDSWMLGGPVIPNHHLVGRASNCGLEFMFRLGKMKD